MKYLTAKRIALGLDASDEYDEDEDDDELSLAELGIEEEDTNPNVVSDAMGWVAKMRREDCKIERHGVDNILITHIPSGCIFRLKEVSKTYMAF
jgi:hypothetical protein